MAKSATKGSGAGSKKSTAKSSPKSAPRKSVAVKAQTRQQSGDGGEEERGKAADMFVTLLQSPLVADLLAVAATAALAALAEHGFNRGDGDRKRAGRAVKAAGKAAAAAVGRRLATEVEEIRKAAKSSSAEA